MRVHNHILIQDPNSPQNDSFKTSAMNSQIHFQDVLDNKLSERQSLQFSKHAFMRLSARDIQLSTEQLQRVQSGISEARQKGIQDSLVLVDDVALVVNVKSKTVITAMTREQENIFTNIDGAVIV